MELLLDKTQKTENYSEADFLANVGIPMRIDARHTIAHNNIMVIDERDGQTPTPTRIPRTTSSPMSPPFCGG